MHSNTDQGEGQQTLAFSVPHKVSRTNIHYTWEHNFMLLVGDVCYSSHLQQMFMSSIKLFHKSCVKELQAGIFCLVGCSGRNKGSSYPDSYKLKQQLFLEALTTSWLFTASLCTAYFASATVPHFDREVQWEGAEFQKVLYQAFFIMNCNDYRVCLPWPTTHFCVSQPVKRCVTWPIPWH